MHLLQHLIYKLLLTTKQYSIHTCLNMKSIQGSKKLGIIYLVNEHVIVDHRESN